MLKKNDRLKNLRQLRKDFGQKCQQIRTEQKLDLHLWESMTEIPYSFITAVEEGRTKPDLAQCNYIAACLDKKLKIDLID